MTPRALRWIAFGIALAVQTGMVVTYGTITDWCFCAILDSGTTRIPPPFMMRFLELSVLPAARMMNGLAWPVLFVLNLEAWFLAALALLHAMALAARIRIRLFPGGAPHARRIGFASREAVRPWHLLLCAVPLMVAAMAGGAMQRRAWLAEAEQVFASAVAAASADRPLPPGVAFSMWEWRGDDMVDVKPEPRYSVTVDPRESGDRFLDRFVVPYEYSGVVRFESGRKYRFAVYRLESEEGWGIDIDRSRPRERW